MFTGAEAPANTKPAVVDGQVVWLPTLTGLLKGETSVEANPQSDLWNALAAAVMAETAIASLETDCADGQPLADVIDIASRRDLS